MRAEDTVLILLAAGRSQRFGDADKLAQEFLHKPVAYHVVTALEAIPFLGRVAVIDPVLNLASANIRSLRSLPATPSDWEISGDGRALAIVGAKEGRLDLLELGAERPAIAAALPAAHSVAAAEAGFWVGLVDGHAVHLSSQGTASDPIEVGTGPVTIISSPSDLAVALAADPVGRRRRHRDHDYAGAPVARPGP